MADVSKIKLLDNTEYDIKDTTARTHANNHGQAFASGLYKITTNAEGHVTAATAVVKADITSLGIPAQDTTYESKTAALDGTDVSLVTTGEKYTWNETVERVDDLETEVDNKAPVIINTASGDIASFDDGADGMPVKGITVAVEPVQDLNGYDNPWPGGASKNLLHNEAQTSTVSGVTFTVSTDGTVVANGTATGTAVFALNDHLQDALENGVKYTLNGSPTNTDTTKWKLRVYNGSDYIDSGSGTAFTFNSSASAKSCDIVVYSGTTVTNLSFKPMIRLYGAYDDTFVPWANICPISGHTAVTVTRTGTNVWDEEWENGTFDLTTGANEASSTQIRAKNLIPVKPSTTYYFKCDVNCWFLFYDKNGNVINYHPYTSPVSGNGTALLNKTFTTSANSRFVRFFANASYGSTYSNNISINYPATDTEYHAYQGDIYRITFPTEAGTVYGGSLTVNEDGTGQLVVDRAEVDLGSLTWSLNGDPTSASRYFSTTSIMNSCSANANIVCEIYAAVTSGISGSDTIDKVARIDANKALRIRDITYSSATEFKSAMSGVQLVYELATPLTYTLTATQITTLLGSNRIWADTGAVSVDYCADTKAYVDRTADIYYVEGSTTDAAGVWTGSVNGLTSYYNGLTVIYVTKVAGKSGSVTLNLNNLGEIQCYNTDKGAIAAITTHYPAGTPILFTYLDNKFVTNDYSRANDNTTVIHQLYHGTGNYVAHSTVYRYQMLFHVDNNTLTPLNNVSNGYNKTNMAMLTGVQFNPFDEILYYSSTTTVSQNGFFGYNTALYTTATCDLRYSFNLTSSANLMTARQLVYLKVSPQTDGLVKLATDNVPITTTLPIIDDGFWYIMLGRCGDNGYTMSLYPEHPVFRYDSESERVVRVLPQDAIVTSETAGLMSSFDYETLQSIASNIYSCPMYQRVSITIPANIIFYTYSNSSITPDSWIVSTNLQQIGFRDTTVEWAPGDGQISFILGKAISYALTFSFVVVGDYVPTLSN